MDKKEIDVEKLKRFFSEGYTEKDREYLLSLFNDENLDKELTQYIRKHWYEFVREEDVPSRNLDHLLHRIHFDINVKREERKARKSIRLLKWSIRIAGIIFIPLALIWGIKGYMSVNQKNETWVEIKAPAYTRAEFVLPDGTKGWLNSNSRLRYSGSFIYNRRVTLVGEAYFDVFKNEKSPFVVNAGNISLKVLGTKFNIASYDDEDNVEVVLEEGRLEFRDWKMNRSYMMDPKSIITYDKNTSHVSEGIVEPIEYSSWKDGRLVFRNDSLDEIKRRLERWYNVDIEVRGNSERGPRLRATFFDESLDEVLSLIRMSLSIDYSIEDRSMTTGNIYSKKKVILTLSPN